MDRKSNNRLNNESGRKREEKKKTIEGNTFLRGQNTEQQYKRKSKRRERTTSGLQMIINLRQTEMMFNKSRVLIMSSLYVIMIFFSSFNHDQIN